MRQITIWICQCVLFAIGIALATLCAQFGGEAVAWAFGIDETIPKAVIFFSSAALIALVAIDSGRSIGWAIRCCDK